MRKPIVVTVVLLVLLAFAVLPAGAITNGTPDGDGHPYVGLALFYFYDSADNTYRYMWRCSGSIISERVVLTAAHCTFDTGGSPNRAVVLFDTDLDDLEFPYVKDRIGDTRKGSAPDCKGHDCYEGSPQGHPDYCNYCYGPSSGLPAFSYRDVGVVVLNNPVVMDTYAELPEEGKVDTLKNKSKIDFVGYGVTYQEPIPGNQLPQPPPYYRWTGPRVRMYAPSEMVSGRFVHSREYMRVALNPGRGSGGLCFGDSGGPDLLGGTDIILAVNSYVTNVNCSGVGYSQRVDIPEVLDWINSFP